jgi:hypothetical protein
LNQNFGGSLKVSVNPMFRQGLLGYLRPKNKGDEEMIRDTDNEYARWRQLAYQIRGRALSRDEFRQSAVGKTWLNTIEILSDDAEAHVATHAQEVGQVAIRDDWEGQINSLLKQLNNIPADTTEAEKKLQAIKDALGIKKEI